MSKRCCWICKSEGDGKTLRPYGKDGADVCFSCAMKPEHVATTEMQLSHALDAAGEVGELTEEGPKPMKHAGEA